MKIIKPANFEWSKRISCSTCQTEFLTETSDLRVSEGGVDFYVVCPEKTCLSVIDIVELPVHIKNFVRSKRLNQDGPNGK